MRKYINFIFFIAIALCPLVTVISSLKMGLMFGGCVAVTFFLLVNFISGLEKIANKDVRVFLYSVLCSGFIIMFKYITSKIGLESVSEFGSKIEISIVSMIILGFYPIYNDTKMTTDDYAERTFYMALIFILSASLYGLIIEILASGSVWGVSLGFDGFKIFTQPFVGLFIIAILTTIANVIRIAIVKHKEKYNLLVDKYTLQIKTILDAKNREGKK